MMQFVPQIAAVIVTVSLSLHIITTSITRNPTRAVSDNTPYPAVHHQANSAYESPALIHNTTAKEADNHAKTHQF
ncbi:hypothetical protein MWU49_05070 [Alcanivorax sp. S6407]|uniref:hypothetical protein n=1 Tax=Alcanivorax sp. S6407 TaxID=2926424 RepID=UPI001FF4F90E|nr:hypothetical protein [Alcanivorax sp. S6407]MCK0153064.1 hypothetical protein [Alcanivorax sp. S6407]